MSELIPQKCGDALTNILWPLDTPQHCPDDLSINNHIRGFPGISLQRISDVSKGACVHPSFGQENCRMPPLCLFLVPPPSIPHSHSLAEQDATSSYSDLQENIPFADFDPEQKQDVDIRRIFDQAHDHKKTNYLGIEIQAHTYNLKILPCY